MASFFLFDENQIKHEFSHIVFLPVTDLNTVETSDSLMCYLFGHILTAEKVRRA
jgi:hypothetical protein